MPPGPKRRGDVAVRRASAPQVILTFYYNGGSFIIGEKTLEFRSVKAFLTKLSISLVETREFEGFVTNKAPNSIDKHVSVARRTSRTRR